MKYINTRDSSHTERAKENTETYYNVKSPEP